MKMARSHLVCTWHSVKHALTAMAIIVAFVVTPPSALAQSALTPEAKSALQEGVAAAKSKNWDSAQRHFDAALAAAPEAPEVLFSLGLLYDRKGGAELVASLWYRAYLAALPAAPNQTQVGARLMELHSSAEARAEKYIATAKEIIKESAPSIDSYCDGGNSDFLYGAFIETIRDVLRREMIVGRDEYVNEIIAAFQSNNCQNKFLYYVVQVLLHLKRDQEATAYAERISGSLKVTALNLFANDKWVEGDRKGAIKLVEETEVVATQLLSTASDETAMWVHIEMALAWCRVGNAAKAIQSLEMIDPNTLVKRLDERERAFGQDWEFSSFGTAYGIVVGTLLSSGNENEAQTALSAFGSRIESSDSQAGMKFQQMVSSAFKRKKNMPAEDLLPQINSELGIHYYQANVTTSTYDWLLEGSVKLARENQFTEPNFWVSYANGSFFSYTVYRNGAELLANTAGLSAIDTVHILSTDSAYLFLGSRKIKEFAADWQN